MLKSKYIILLFFALLLTNFTYAQKQFYWMPEISLMGNINSVDLTKIGEVNSMSAPMTIGSSLGMGVRFGNKKETVSSTQTIGLQIVPQLLKFNNTNALGTDLPNLRFTNYYLYWKGMTNIKLANHGKGFWEIGFGPSARISLHNQSAEQNSYFAPYIDEISGEEYNYFNAFTNIQWGRDNYTGEKRAALFLDAIIQPAYVYKINENQLLKVGLDLSYNLSINFNQMANNRGMEVIYDQHRNEIGRTIFRDRHLVVGLNVTYGF